MPQTRVGCTLNHPSGLARYRAAGGGDADAFAVFEGGGGVVKLLGVVAVVVAAFAVPGVTQFS